MDLKEITSEINGLKEKFVSFMAKFSQAEQAPSEPAQFGQATTADGTILKYEGSLAEGTNVVVVGVDGVETPAEGAYTLEDGTVINCEAGVVTSVGAAEAEQVAAQEPANYDQKFSDMETNFNSQISDLSAKIEALTTQLSGAMDLTKSAVETVGKFAAMTPEPTEKKTTKSDNRENRIAQINQLRKNNK